MKNQILLIFLLTFCSTLFSQNKIEGIVKDESHQGVFYATVALYNVKDSLAVKAESTNEKGRFVLNGIKMVL